MRDNSNFRRRKVRAKRDFSKRFPPSTGLPLELPSVDYRSVGRPERLRTYLNRLELPGFLLGAHQFFVDIILYGFQSIRAVCCLLIQNFAKARAYPPCFILGGVTGFSPAWPWCSGSLQLGWLDIPERHSKKKTDAVSLFPSRSYPGNSARLRRQAARRPGGPAAGGWGICSKDQKTHEWGRCAFLDDRCFPISRGSIYVSSRKQERILCALL